MNLQMYFIGLVLVVLYILIGLDDFIWDIYSVLNHLKANKKKIIFPILDKDPPKLIALCMAAWNEDNVIENVVSNIISSQKYPRSMYHIFIGVYPNDLRTMEKVNNLSQTFSNVHMIINYKNGPTSKAQNLNYVIDRIKIFEKNKGWKFSAITIHDAEDVVHPYELLVTNHLIQKYEALQFPVFPIIRKPRLNNFFKNLTTNTYADEFAENHFLTMVNRGRIGAFVPSAGTGFALSRKIIDMMGYEILPEDSLTEDYKLSLTLYEKGIQMYYVMEKLKRIDDNGNVKWDFIATRSIFPNTFKKAVKQKTRWITGITMQSYKLKEIMKNNMSFVGRYSIYKDQKAKLGNLLSIIGYPVFIYFLISLVYPLDPIYPYYSLSWYLSLFVTVMMLQRQVFRFVALYNVYGLKSAMFGVLLFPLIPIRVVWGNIINFTATINAFIKVFKKNKENRKVENSSLGIIQGLDMDKIMDKAYIEAPKIAIYPDNRENKTYKWDKTDHDFVDNNTLKKYHRKLGDILIDRGFITPIRLNEVLNLKPKDVLLGDYLISKNILNECDLLKALSLYYNTSFINIHELHSYELNCVDIGISQKYLDDKKLLPLRMDGNKIVIACSYDCDYSVKLDIVRDLALDIDFVFAEKETIKEGINRIYNSNNLCNINSLEKLKGKIHDIEQEVIIKKFSVELDVDEIKMAMHMGLIN